MSGRAPQSAAGGAAHRYPSELVTYMRGHGRRKVLFGTNYPVLTASQALKRLNDLGLDDEAGDLFLSGNAARLCTVRSPRRPGRAPSGQEGQPHPGEAFRIRGGG